jgi:hypothetical protein
MATKWGIYSAGKICHDFVDSVLSMKTTDHEVTPKITNKPITK